MTYEEQKQIELLNKSIIDNIVNNVLPQDFINYYLEHNQKETCEHFGLRTTKQLTKLLKMFNYDFSKPKPSKFKGKSAARTHDSYIEGGKKSANTQKANWNKKSDIEKENWAKKMSEAHSTNEFKQTIRKINKDFWTNLTDDERAAIKLKKSKSNKETWMQNKSEILEKSHETKKRNHSFNSSMPEEKYYAFLLTKYSDCDVIRQYKDARYPHACDFYIKSEDLYIELNLDWTHGMHPYNSESEEDQKKLKIWQEKAKESQFYKKAIYTWTQLDVQKFKDARDNNLNYKVYYKENDLYE